MSLELLETLQSETSEAAVAAKTKITKLHTRKLKGIKSESEIVEICHEVIGAVDKILLVHIDEVKLLERKLKKHKKEPIARTDDDIWKDGARIRNDLDAKKWKKHPLKGWIWYREKGGILGIIYHTHHEK